MFIFKNRRSYIDNRLYATLGFGFESPIFCQQIGAFIDDMSALPNADKMNPYGIVAPGGHLAVDLCKKLLRVRFPAIRIGRTEFKGIGLTLGVHLDKIGPK